MLQTVEVRWFFDKVPLVEDLHFETVNQLQQRTDWYLMPCNPRCGIKVREGMLETKLQVDSFGLRTFSPWEGLMEKYKKWSLKFEDENHPSVHEMTSVNWVPVQKHRRLQRFEVSGNRTHPSRTKPHNGCEFEMTELKIGVDSYWTVGFEAVGQSDALESNLQTVASEITGRGGLLAEFTAKNSFGYAQWLSKINS